MNIVEAPSPNFGARRNGARPDLVVLHYTGMQSAEAALDRLRDPEAEVSAHYLIAEDGRVWRLVPESERAWHAGAGSWRRAGDVNSRSVGIELANAGPLAEFPPFPEPQMAALEVLLGEVMARWGIRPAGVIAHSDMAPGRKTDPGPKFDWRRLSGQGLSIWPQSGRAAGEWGAFRAAAEQIGYAPPEIGGWEAVLDAFRLRWRPGAAGAIAPEDVGRAEAVAAALGGSASDQAWARAQY